MFLLGSSISDEFSMLNLLIFLPFWILVSFRIWALAPHFISVKKWVVNLTDLLVPSESILSCMFQESSFWGCFWMCDYYITWKHLKLSDVLIFFNLRLSSFVIFGNYLNLFISCWESHPTYFAAIFDVSQVSEILIFFYFLSIP